MFVYDDVVAELLMNMTYVSTSTMLSTTFNYFYCILFVFTEDVKHRIVVCI